ncbi:unnamed protein product [Withania somnifera]
MAASGVIVPVALEKAESLVSERLISLWGLKGQVGKLKRNLEIIKLFSDAQNPKFHDIRVFEKLSYNADNVLDKIQYEILWLKAGDDAVDVSVRLYIIATKIASIKDELKKINKDAERFASRMLQESELYEVETRETVSFATDPIFVGRDEQLNQIIDMCLSRTEENVFVLSIVGMGGLGKTCLARQVYNDVRINSHFEVKIWVCVSKDFDVKKIFELMLEAITSVNNQLKSQEHIVQKLREMLMYKRCLLVLDDVWNGNFLVWESFRRPLKGLSICILVTTRLQTVASITADQSISLETLSDHCCWLVLRELAFGHEEVPADVEDIGKKIANKCEGLPLAAQLVGNVFRYKGIEAWLSILRTNSLGGEENILFESLKLSYDHLPSSSLRRCFLHCSIFPRDYTIVREEIIQLWMAEGLLSKEENLEMEDKGNKFFDILVKNSLLQDVEMDMYGNLWSCKMHGLVHDFAQFILTSHVYASRTLISRNKISANPLMDMKFLRALILIGENIMVLPSSIGKLIYLRYLDLSKSRISELPNSICKLYFLQTLRVPYIRKLPNGVKKLRSLRHLYFSSFVESTKFPKQIGQLTSLRTLNLFNLTLGNGIQIKELGCLKNLGGELVIKNLQLVHHKEEAQKADLNKKSNLYKLEYSWCHNEVENSENHDESVLDGLDPPSNLRFLNIVNYLGTRFPSWVCECLPLNLVELRFHNCRRCREVPSLGQLKLLSHLELVGLHAVECIGSTLYGVEFNNSGSNSKNAKIQAFPALKKLVLDDMPSLTVWKDVQLTPTTDEDGGRFDVRMFPGLRELSISKCPLLKTTPSHFEVLRVLSIEGVDSKPVLEICRNSTSLEEIIIKDLKGITSGPDEILNKDDILAHLEAVSCPKYSPEAAPTVCEVLTGDIPYSLSVPLSDLGMLSNTDLRLEMLSGSYSNRMQNQVLSSSYRNLVSEEDSYQLIQSKRDPTIPENLIFNESSAGLIEPPPENVWKEAVVMIMTDNHLSLLPTSPDCPHLLLLFLQRNNRLRSIPNSFFIGMPRLRVLDLSNTKIKVFPSSLFNLLDLQVLILRNCHSIYEIPENKCFGALKSLEVLDFSATELYNLPPGIGKLTRLKYLHLSFYGADDEREASCLPDDLFSTDIIEKLPDLRVLSLDVHPEDRRWSRDASQIIKDINRLQKLRYLQFYFPTVALLEMFINMSDSWKNNLLTRFKLVVGQNVKRVVDRVPQSEMHKYEKHDRCLRFVNGDVISVSVMNVLKCITAFYLDHHTSVSTVSQFELTGSEDLKFLLLRECPNIQVLVENEEGSEPVMPALEHLGIHYLWRLENICRKCSLPSGSFGSLKSLMIDTCPKLKCLFEDYSILRNLSTLEKLIVKDCVLLKEMVRTTREIVRGEVLPRLEILQLSYLPQLVLQSLWMDPAPNRSFCSLKSLTVNACQNVEFIFSHSVLQNLLNLEELVIESCLLLKQIIETSQVTIEFQVLPRLKVLKLSYLPELVSQNMWTDPIPMGSFAVLTSVIVKKCSKIEFIFPQTMLHCLSNLEELAVEDCKTLKELIEETEEDQVIHEDHGSGLCSLKELKLRHLPELVRLSNSVIPYVEKPDIVECPKLKGVKFEELSDQVPLQHKYRSFFWLHSLGLKYSDSKFIKCLIPRPINIRIHNRFNIRVSHLPLERKYVPFSF